MPGAYRKRVRTGLAVGLEGGARRIEATCRGPWVRVRAPSRAGARGRGETVREPNQRIVCLTEEPTEILYLLGEQERIVGVSAYAVRPPEARKQKPVVSAFTAGSLRKIEALEPDLVIGFSDMQAKLASELIAAGLQVLIFNQRSIEEILGVIVSVGRLVGAEARARVLVSEYETRLAEARSRAKRRGVRPRVYFEEWFEPMVCGIRWVSELIDAVGGDDVFAARARGPSAKERVVDVAAVLERAPDVVLASWCGKRFDRAAFEARPGFSELPAVRSGRVHELAPSIVLQPGPALFTDGLDAVEALLS
jgi:iron complex transport system substrate-binding protein